MKDLRKALVILLSLVLCECKNNTNVDEPVNNTGTTQEVKDENKEDPNDGLEGKERPEEKEESNKYKIIDVNEPEFLNETNGDYKFKHSALSFYTVSNSELPHIDLVGFINDLDGYFDSENISNSYNKETGEFRLFYKGDLEIIFDINKDLIKSSDCYNFYAYTNQPSGSDYDDYISGVEDYFVKDSTFEMDVGAYDFDIIYIEGKCLIPLFLANVLFCSFNYFNIFYNNESCFVTSGEATNLYRYYNCEANNTNQSKKLREESMNSLYLIFDYFYGLKGYKGIDGGFKEYIASLDNGRLLEKFLSEKPSDNMDALSEFIYKDLDELHTRIDLPTFYASRYYTVDPEYGEFYKNYFERKNTQLNYRDSYGWTGNAIRYIDDYGFAIITLNSFDVGTINQVKNKDGSIKDDAWRYDSYYFMKAVMQHIENKQNIKDIVIDLSTNGGGSLAALERVIGFLTDEDIKISMRDTLQNSYEVGAFKIDTDGDGKYDNDAYDKYNWHLLTGVNTFSAANLMTAIFKQMNLGDVIGQRSGGGMCAVFPTVLADGTGIAISSPSCLQYLGTDENGKYTFSDIEAGIEPDKKVDYEKFYDTEYLYKVIKGIVQ